MHSSISKAPSKEERRRGHSLFFSLSLSLSNPHKHKHKNKLTSLLLNTHFYTHSLITPTTISFCFFFLHKLNPKTTSNLRQLSFPVIFQCVSFLRSVRRPIRSDERRHDDVSVLTRQTPQPAHRGRHFSAHPRRLPQIPQR